MYVKIRRHQHTRIHAHTGVFAKGGITKAVMYGSFVVW